MDLNEELNNIKISDISEEILKILNEYGEATNGDVDPPPEGADGSLSLSIQNWIKDGIDDIVAEWISKQNNNPEFKESITTETDELKNQTKDLIITVCDKLNDKLLTFESNQQQSNLSKNIIDENALTISLPDEEKSEDSSTFSSQVPTLEETTATKLDLENKNAKQELLEQFKSYLLDNVLSFSSPSSAAVSSLYPEGISTFFPSEFEKTTILNGINKLKSEVLKHEEELENISNDVKNFAVVKINNDGVLSEIEPPSIIQILEDLESRIYNFLKQNKQLTSELTNNLIKKPTSPLTENSQNSILSLSTTNLELYTDSLNFSRLTILGTVQILEEIEKYIIIFPKKSNIFSRLRNTKALNPITTILDIFQSKALLEGFDESGNYDTKRIVKSITKNSIRKTFDYLISEPSKAIWDKLVIKPYEVTKDLLWNNDYGLFKVGYDLVLYTANLKANVTKWNTQIKKLIFKIKNPLENSEKEGGGEEEGNTDKESKPKKLCDFFGLSKFYLDNPDISDDTSQRIIIMGNLLGGIRNPLLISFYGVEQFEKIQSNTKLPKDYITKNPNLRSILMGSELLLKKTKELDGIGGDSGGESFFEKLLLTNAIALPGLMLITAGGAALAYYFFKRNIDLNGNNLGSYIAGASEFVRFGIPLTGAAFIINRGFSKIAARKLASKLPNISKIPLLKRLKRRSPNVLTKSQVLSKASKWLKSPWFAIFGFILDGISGLYNGFGKEFGKTTGAILSIMTGGDTKFSWSGLGLNTLSWAGLGATVGSVIPVPGVSTGLGALIGGLLGGVLYVGAFTIAEISRNWGQIVGTVKGWWSKYIVKPFDRAVNSLVVYFKDRSILKTIKTETEKTVLNELEKFYEMIFGKKVNSFSEAWSIFSEDEKIKMLNLSERTEKLNKIELDLKRQIEENKTKIIETIETLNNKDTIALMENSVNNITRNNSYLNIIRDKLTNIVNGIGTFNGGEETDQQNNEQPTEKNKGIWENSVNGNIITITENENPQFISKSPAQKDVEDIFKKELNGFPNFNFNFKIPQIA